MTVVNSYLLFHTLSFMFYAGYGNNLWGAATRQCCASLSFSPRFTFDL